MALQAMARPQAGQGVWQRSSLSREPGARGPLAPSSARGVPLSRVAHRRTRGPLPGARTVPAAASSAATPNGTAEPRWTPQRVRQAWDQWWTLREEGAGGSQLPPQQELRAVLAKYWELLGPDRGLLAVAVLFMSLAAFMELAIPNFISASVFAATKAADQSLFRRTLLNLTGVIAGYAVFAGLRGYFFSLINTNLLQRIRGRLFSTLVRQEVSFFDGQEVGGLTSRLGTDCSIIARLLATNVNVALRNSLQCIGGAVYLFILSPRMALASACVIGTLWAVAIRYGSFTRRAQRTYQDALAESTAVAEESFLLSRLIRAFGTEESAVARYDATLHTLRHISIRQVVAYASYVTSKNWLYNFTRVAALLVAGISALAGSITPQQLTTFVLYVEFVAAAMLNVCDELGPISEAIGASERVLAFLDLPQAPQLEAGVVPTSVQGELQIEGVSFAYPSRPDVMALNDVNLTIPRGKLVALVGLSGSGKSTLVSLVQRLYDPSQGRILLDGVDLRELDAPWFRSQIGVVLQDSRLFGLTVAENISYGAPGTSRAEVEAAARLANAHDFIAALPQGYDTPVTDKLLSGGQRQRIAIARAIVRNPRILILDEATSALDAESEAAVQGALDHVMRSEDRTVLVIAHRLSTVRHADLTVVMDHGRVAEVGTHAELVVRRGIYAALVRRQSGKMEQDRDLAPHEMDAAAGHGDADGSSGAAAAASAREEAIAMAGGSGGVGAAPDSLVQLRGSSRPSGATSRNVDELQ